MNDRRNQFESPAFVVMGIRRQLPLLAILCLPALLSAEVLIERTYMPFDVAPSSFAIGLPGGINFCFDPVRGGVSYAWTGGFLDITNVRPGIGGKHITAVDLLGPVVYRENGAIPLRRGDPARVPIYEFKGYVLHDDAVEFQYTLDGLPIREEIRVRPGGGGLTRRFRVEGATDATWWYVIDGRPATNLTPAADGHLMVEVDFEKGTP